MSNVIIAIICVSILFTSLLIFLYTWLAIREKYMEIDSDMKFLKDLVASFKRQLDTMDQAVDGMFKREGEVHNDLRDVLELNDQIIKDNHKISYEVALLAAQIRKGVDADDTERRGSDETDGGDILPADEGLSS